MKSSSKAHMENTDPRLRPLPPSQLSTAGVATRETLNAKLAINQKHFLPGGDSITRPTEILSSTEQRGKSCTKQ